MRKLVTIREISKIESIEGADRIELAHVDGWQTIIKKGDFNVGDRVAYFEIDSLLPELPQYEFLRKCCYVGENKSVNGAGFRIKTIKLKKTLSQGLIQPLLPEVVDLPVGTDVTDVYGVKKYEKPIPATLRGKVRGNFPSFIEKTDQERIQNIKERDWLEYRKHLFEVTLKLDGSSMTVFRNENTYGVCSRNIWLKEDDESTFSQVARKLRLFDALRDLGMNIAIQGELVGPGIQKNPYGLKEHDFYVFDIFDIDKQKKMPPGRRMDILTMLDIKSVPLVEWEMDISKYGITLKNDILKLAQNIHEIWDTQKFGIFADGPFEGLVFKSIVDGDLHFKVINNDYLLKTGG